MISSALPAAFTGCMSALLGDGCVGASIVVQGVAGTKFSQLHCRPPASASAPAAPQSAAP